jgi:hypothetical protein
MLKRQRDSNRDISKATRLLEPLPALRFLCDLPVLHPVLRSLGKEGSSKNRFDKLKAPSLPRGDGGGFGFWTFSP